MNRWLAYGMRAIVSAELALACCWALPDSASAQFDQSRQTFDNIRTRRSVQQLERQQQQTVPDQQRRQMQQLRRDLSGQNALDSGRPQATRRLDRLEADLTRPSQRPESRPPLVPSQSAELPSSLDPTPPLSSFGRPLRNAIGMIERAETALAEGRINQARSDLSTATSELSSASADTAEEALAIDNAGERIVMLESRLAGN